MMKIISTKHYDKLCFKDICTKFIESIYLDNSSNDEESKSEVNDNADREEMNVDARFNVVGFMRLWRDKANRFKMSCSQVFQNLTG